MITLLRIETLPDEALAAAARFHADMLPKIAALDAEDLVLAFPPADHTHRAWRLAVVQQLARTHAPARVNALEGDDEDGIAAALAYLETAAGVTGQLLPLDGTGAGELHSAQE